MYLLHRKGGGKKELGEVKKKGKKKGKWFSSLFFFNFTLNLEWEIGEGKKGGKGDWERGEEGNGRVTVPSTVIHNLRAFFLGRREEEKKGG